MPATFRPLSAIQIAIVSALRADGALAPRGDPAAPAVPKVYDRVPDAAQPPYVTCGEDDMLWDGWDEYQSATIRGRAHVWSRQPGRMECKAICEDVLTAMDAVLDITASGARVVDRLADHIRILDDPDGVTKHGIVGVNYETEAL